MLLATLVGFVFGFVGSMPSAGPIAALVSSRVLEGRVGSARSLAAGAALAEGGYAYLAFWGFSGILTHYAWIESAARVASAVISIGLGLYLVHGAGAPAARTDPAPADPSPRRRRSFLLGLTLTALNPALIAAWSAAITAVYSLGLVRFEPDEALPFSLGAFAGITVWFSMLVGFLQRHRARISGAVVARLHRGVGVILVLAGLALAARLV